MRGNAGAMRLAVPRGFGNRSGMDEHSTLFDALSHPQRLAVFRLLVRHAPHPVAAGDIGAAMGLRPSTLSAYLSALTEAGLIAQHRQATRRLYALAPDALTRLADSVFQGACLGRALPPEPARGTGQGGVQTVLFLCHDNAALSQWAEALLRAQAGERFEVFSAGLSPAADLPADTRVAMQAQGLDPASLWPKPASLVAGEDSPPLDCVIALSARAASAEWPRWPGNPVLAHWPLAETPPGADAAPITVGLLKQLIDRFVALPADLPRHARQAALDMLGVQGALAARALARDAADAADAANATT